MSKQVREAIADWLIVIGAIGLFGSLFLSWSHQFSPAFLAEWGASDLLRGVPRDPTAWQAYSVADVLLALLVGGLLVVALLGTRPARVGALIATAIGLGFALRALSDPPTNGANILNPALGVPGYFPSSASAAAGETVAIAAMLVAVAGLVLSFSAD